MTYLTDVQLHKAAQYLETREGGFANAIALAYYRADKDNEKISITHIDDSDYSDQSN